MAGNLFFITEIVSVGTLLAIFSAKFFHACHDQWSQGQQTAGHFVVHSVAWVLADYYDFFLVLKQFSLGMT